MQIRILREFANLEIGKVYSIRPLVANNLIAQGIAECADPPAENASKDKKSKIKTTK